MSLPLETGIAAWLADGRLCGNFNGSMSNVGVEHRNESVHSGE